VQRLPLPETIPEVFKMLPEFFVDDILEYYLFVVRFAPSISIIMASLTLPLTSHTPDVLSPVIKKELLDFVLTFLSSTWYIKNPYLKAKLVQVGASFL
jgi:ubiquitin conjugation factor E4 B